MNSPFRSLLLGAALAACAFPALAQTNININIGQPGFYGRLDIGGFGPPPVVYAQPVVVVREVTRYRAEPVYLRVPPGHRQHWARYCGRYDACGRPVMFVRDDWYTNTYAPRYRERHGERAGRHHEERFEGYEREERHGGYDKHDKHGGGHGNGNGHGNGHGRGHH